MFHVPEKYRMPGDGMGYGVSGNNGVFEYKRLRIIASDGYGWEHCSISLSDRTPRWNEMCQIKDLFWDKEDCVIQYHPPETVYIRTHPHVLHLWRPIGVVLPVPPIVLV